MKSKFLIKLFYIGKYSNNNSKVMNLFTLYASIVLGISVGIQWMTAAFLIIGLHPRPRSLEQLTDLGKYWFRPEYDTGIYILGCFIALILALILSLKWQRYIGLVKNIRKEEVNFAAIRLVCSGLLSYFFQVILILLFKNLILEFWKQPVLYEWKVIITGLWSLILVIPGGIALMFTHKIQHFKKTYVR